MKPNTLSSLVALALAGSAWAASPYDTPFGLQWNFMIGAAGDDGSTEAAVTSDGTIYIMNRTHNNSTWGSGATGSINSGMGAITPLGQKLYGTTLYSLPGLMTTGQSYLSGVSAVGNRAYVAFNGSGGQYWTGEDGTDNNKVNVYSVDSSGLSESIADRHRLSSYASNTGTAAVPPPLRTDLLQPTTTGLKTFPSQHRSHDSAMRVSTMDMIITGDGISDFGTLGDYGGVSFSPFIGRYNFTTNTLTGPLHQPVVSGNPTAGNNFAYFITCNVDQSTGWYYGAGYNRYTNTTTFDPDGVGALAPMAMDPTRANGIIVAYDATDVPVYGVVWNSISTSPDVVTSERILSIAPTNDGSNSVFYAGYTTGDMAGFSGTNANPGVNSDAYIEKRDATGAVVWSDQLAMSTVSDGIYKVDVDATGDLYVSGYMAEVVTGKRDSWLRKYKKTGPNSYTKVWDTTIVNPLDPTNTVGNEQIYDHAFDSNGEAVYISANTDVQWANTTGHVLAGNKDLLLQKLTPGDFNSDGIVDFADVQLAGTATKPGLPGVDTYDFNRDGDSTLADTTYMITNIMDRALGDIAQDSLVTDVDNADIGKAIGASGVGTLYLDGDMDWDGDVDTADVTAVAGAFTGAKTPGKWTNGTPGATLRYRADDGQVWIHASQAAGGIVTSFQLENAAGTFVPASYTGPTGGSFGGALEDDTTHVLGDTDLTLAGASGTVSLGTVFPTGMDLAGLTAYLTTAVYTGQPGSGQMLFNLVVGDLASPYGTWAGTNAPTGNPDDDYDGDGVSNAVEFVLGGDKDTNDLAKLPVASNSAGNLVFTFLRDQDSIDGTTSVAIQVGTDLSVWTSSYNVGADTAGSDTGVTVSKDSPAAGTDTVTLSVAMSPDTEKFARLKVTIAP